MKSQDTNGTDISSSATESGPRVALLLDRHEAFFRIISIAAYLWLILCTMSYGITQSTVINTYGIRPGTPLPLAILIAPAASIFDLAQYLTYGSVHVCGTYASPCAWPNTWPGPHFFHNVNMFDDIWFAMFASTFVLYLVSSRSLLRSIRAISVAPIILGVILYFDDNYWFYMGFSDELTRKGFGWLTNENLTFIALVCFTLCTVCLKVMQNRRFRGKKISCFAL